MPYPHSGEWLQQLAGYILFRIMQAYKTIIKWIIVYTKQFILYSKDGYVKTLLQYEIDVNFQSPLSYWWISESIVC